MSVKRKEIGFVNVDISVSDTEFRLWACNWSGVSVLRIKAVGKVHYNKELNEIIVTGKARKKAGM